MIKLIRWNETSSRPMKNAGPTQLSPKNTPNHAFHETRDPWFFTIGDVSFQHKKSILGVHDMEHGDTLLRWKPHSTEQLLCLDSKFPRSMMCHGPLFIPA